MHASTDFTLLGVFVAGFLSSLTPCVYPLIPITLALFGARTEPSRLRAFFLSICYVLGIALTYTALGMFSAYSGSLFGSFQSNPIVIFVMTIFLVYLTLCMLEITSFSLGGNLQSKASQVGGKGFGGAFLMGAASGIIAAPCVGPVLAGILALAAASKDIVQGGLLLFTYSIGLGLIFIVLGTFSSLLNAVPKSGGWLSVVKYLLATALMITAFSLVSPFICLSLPSWSRPNLMLALGGGMIAMLILAGISFRKNLPSLKFLTCLILAICSYDLYSLYERPASTVEIIWEHSLDDAITKAQTQSKHVFVDLFAEWCAECMEMEKKTFSQKAVQDRLKDFIIVKVDFTDPGSDYNTALASKYSVSGLPTMMILSPDGKEIREKRIEGFLWPEEFLKRLEGIQ